MIPPGCLTERVALALMSSNEHPELESPCSSGSRRSKETVDDRQACPDQPSRPSDRQRRQSKGMSLSSSIPLTRLRNTTPTHNEIQEVDEIFHNLNASVIFDAPATVSGPRWKQDLHALLEKPTSSSSAFVMHVFITSLIIISALVTVLETVPTFRKISNAVWFGFETTLVALFTIEYIARSLAWSGSWRLFLRWVICMSCLFPAFRHPPITYDRTN